MQKHQLLEILFQAQASEVGLEVATNNPTSLRAKFYALMRQEEGFALSISLAPTNPNGALYIVKKDSEDAS